MATDIEELRRDVTDAQRRHAAAVAGVTGAEARAEAVREELRAEFGVGTLEESRALLLRLRRQVDERAAEVRAHLEASR